jgi:hypothetical protein
MINMFINQIRYRNILCLFLLLAGFCNVFAAKADSLLNGIRIEAKAQYGFIYPHHKAIQYLLAGNINGFEVGFSTESTGSKPYEELYRFPRYGVAYNFTDFSNPGILGYAHGFFCYMDIPFFYPKHNFMVNYQVDCGVSYITKKFDLETDPLNLAISSSVDVYIGVDFNARFKIANNNEFKTALELTHYSNGKWRSPNLGLNTMTLSVAWLYSIKPSYKPVMGKKNNLPRKRNFIEVTANSGFKRDDLLNEKMYFISTGVIDYYHSFCPKYAFGGGIDFFHDSSLGPTKEAEEDIKQQNSDNFQAGAHLGFLVICGRMHVLVNAGYYGYVNYFKYSRVYSRIGFRYSLTQHIFLNVNVKAHYAIADYIEWGIGYRFNLNSK